MKRTLPPLVTGCLCLLLASFSVQAREAANLSGRFSFFMENKGQLMDQYQRPRNDIDFYLQRAGLSLFVSAGRLHYQFSCPEDADSAKIFFRQLTHPEDVRKVPSVQASRYTGYRLDMELQGADFSVKPVAEQLQSFRLNYYFSRCGAEGITDVKSFQKITYPNIYPNIDWVLYLKDGHVKYDFILHKGADPADIRIRYGGATDARLRDDGSLLIQSPMGTITEDKPFAYTQSDSLPVPCRFIQKGTDWQVALGQYTGALVLDPGLSWATYYGGSGWDVLEAAYAADNGYVYVTGGTNSISQIATSGAYQTTFMGAMDSMDAFLAKFNTDGTLSWATYYGGTGMDVGWDVTMDKAGAVYMTGYTQSGSGISTPGSHQFQYGGSTDAFLAKFTDSGHRLWVSYYGGSGYDDGQHLAVDGDALYMCGTTYSISHIATTSSFQPGYMVNGNNRGNAYLVKWDTAGHPHWATYYGAGTTTASSVVVDAGHNVYLAGSTSSDINISTAGSHQPAIGGFTDEFIAKFNASGQRLWGTYYGGMVSEGSNPAMVVDAANHLYLTGVTYSGENIATPGASRELYSNSVDGFLASFDDSGTLLWGTYISPHYPYGGIYAGEIALSHCGSSVYVAGDVYPSVNIDATPDALHPLPQGGGFDGVLMRYSTDGVMEYSSYLGGTDIDHVLGMSMSEDGNLYVAGASESDSGIATQEAYQAVSSGGQDAYIMKFQDVYFNPDDPKTSFDSVICHNVFDLPYTVSAAFQSNNIFTAELSDSSGDFSNPVVLGTVNGASDGSIHCFIPSGISPGADYRIRIRGSAPATLGSCPIHVVLAMPPVPSITVTGDTLISSAPANNQWLLNGTAISGATDQRYTASGNGWYQVIVTDPVTGCSSISDSAGLGVEHVSETVLAKELLRVYPNPFGQKLIVSLSATLADPQQYSLVMTDALGVPVLKRDALRYTNELHFAALANGTYFLTVRGPRGKAVYTVVKRE